MKDSKKQPAPQTFNLEFPVLGELRLKSEKPATFPKPAQPLEDDVNEDLIRRLINRLKKM